MTKLKFVVIVLLSNWLILGFMTASAVADPLGHGKKPLRGNGIMYVVPEAGTIDCLAPDGSVVTPFPRQLGALARYTVLGRTVGTIIAEECNFDPANGSLIVTGPVDQVSASGDEIHTEYVAVFAPDFSFDLDVYIWGGTGRFTDACGEASGGGDFDPIAGMGSTWLSGWLMVPAGNDRGSHCE